MEKISFIFFYSFTLISLVYTLILRKEGSLTLISLVCVLEYERLPYHYFLDRYQDGFKIQDTDSGEKCQDGKYPLIRATFTILKYFFSKGMNEKDIHLFILLYLDIISLYSHSKETRVPYLDFIGLCFKIRKVSLGLSKSLQ